MLLQQTNAIVQSYVYNSIVVVSFLINPHVDAISKELYEDILSLSLSLNLSKK